MSRPIPVPDPQSGLAALRAMLRERHPLAAMQVFHAALGDIFRINLPGFKPVVMVGPGPAHFVLVEGREGLRWRNENDPVTHLLRHGVLVEDGEPHDRLRRMMSPPLHKQMLAGYVAAMVRGADQGMSAWQDGGIYDMLPEMRKVALLILMDTLYSVDFAPHIRPLWNAILGDIRYISPGLWMLWPGVPRLGYRRAIRRLDAYLFHIIEERRALLAQADMEPQDLLGLLITGGLNDDMIRDQLLTMLIAGHDTSTALLAWSLFLLGSHPDALARVQAEVDLVLGCDVPDIERLGHLEYLNAVMREALRLYPPIHLGSRVAAVDLEYGGYTIPAGERVIYSIYLSQRHPDYWPDPDLFIPERHLEGDRSVPYSWLAFGGGPRNCIGAAYGQVEVKAVLARMLQKFHVRLVEKHVHPHMGATLEPRPGVRMGVQQRQLSFDSAREHGSAR